MKLLPISRNPRIEAVLPALIRRAEITVLRVKSEHQDGVLPTNTGNQIQALCFMNFLIPPSLNAYSVPGIVLGAVDTG